MQERGADSAIARFTWPDLAAVATSLGGQGLTIGSPAPTPSSVSPTAGSSGVAANSARWSLSPRTILVIIWQLLASRDARFSHLGSRLLRQPDRHRPQDRYHVRQRVLLPGPAFLAAA